MSDPKSFEDHQSILREYERLKKEAMKVCGAKNEEELGQKMEETLKAIGGYIDAIKQLKS